MEKKKVATRKIKKKKWFPIIAPKIFNERVLGETYLEDSRSMKGRYLTLNLMNVLQDPKKQSTNVQFLIHSVKEGRGMTKLVKYELISGYLKRLIRRGRTKVEDSFRARTKGGQAVRVKPLIITTTKVPNSVATKLRLIVREELKKAISNEHFEGLVEEFLRGAFQRGIKGKLSKITPVRNFEIRIFKLEVEELGEKKDIEVESEEKVETKEVKVEETPKEEVVEEEAKKEDAEEEKKETEAKESKKEVEEEVSDKEVLEKDVEEKTESKKQVEEISETQKPKEEKKDTESKDSELQTKSEETKEEKKPTTKKTTAKKDSKKE